LNKRNGGTEEGRQNAEISFVFTSVPPFLLFNLAFPERFAPQQQHPSPAEPIMNLWFRLCRAGALTTDGQ
jgi:hypothetical protein